MRDLLDATDRLGSDDALDDSERETLLQRVHTYQDARVSTARAQQDRAFSGVPRPPQPHRSLPPFRRP